MDDHAKIIGRVRKMLALANDKAASEGERDNAMRMAHATLAKYNLDLAQVEASTGKKSSDEPREREAGEFYGRPWARNVCASVADLFFCHYIYVPNSDAQLIQHYFIGRRSNAVTALEMAKFLVGSIRREAKREARAVGQGNPYVRSFCLGAAGAVRRRVNALVEESTKPAPVPSTGTALVLASLYQSERSENQLVVKQMFPKLSPGRSGKGINNFDAYQSGRTYGENVSLNRQITSK